MRKEIQCHDELMPIPASATDSLIALVLAVGAAVWANQQRMPQGGLKNSLEMRVTALNASFRNSLRCALAAMHGGTRSLSAICRVDPPHARYCSGRRYDDLAACSFILRRVGPRARYRRFWPLSSSRLSAIKWLASSSQPSLGLEDR